MPRKKTTPVKPARAGAKPKPGPKATPTSAPTPALRRLYVLSDSTGNLARHMVVTFLTQFPHGAFDLSVRTFVDTPAKADAALAEVRAAPGIVFHAAVSADLKGRINGFCADAGLPVCDLTGDFVHFLARASGVDPTPDRMRLHEVDQTYYRRIEAIEFTMAHDDGLGLDTLGGADVVLAGVSRTSKTPTCIYLAQQGYKAGNVALAVEVQPPRELLAMPREKVIGLVIDPHRLSAIRTRRHAGWGMTDTGYNMLDAVRREVAWSRKLFAQQGWQVLDVTNQAIEETAGRIVERLRL